MTTKDSSLSTLLVGLANPNTMPRLLDLAARIHAAQECAVVATHVVTVRDQIALGSARKSPEVMAGRQLLQDALECTAALGLPARAVVEIGREIHEGLLNAARNNDADLVLVGYSEETEIDASVSRSFDRVMHRVARGFDADLVVAEFRKETAQNLLVPLKPEPNLRLIGLLLRALTAGDDVAVRFLHIPAAEGPGNDQVEKRLADAGLADLGKLDVVSGDDVINTVVAESSGHDMVLLEASSHPSLADDVLGSRAERIAERVDATALLVRARRR